MAQLPLSKIKKIAKLDPDVTLINQEATQALTLACEEFVKTLSKEVYLQAQLSKRKTLQLKDFQSCISNVQWLDFLDGALSGWADTAALRLQDDTDIGENETNNQGNETTENNSESVEQISPIPDDAQIAEETSQRSPELISEEVTNEKD